MLMSLKYIAIIYKSILELFEGIVFSFLPQTQIALLWLNYCFLLNVCAIPTSSVASHKINLKKRITSETLAEFYLL